jgi:DNA-binding XRE family transcriptional regulator
MIAVEHESADPSWIELCRELGIHLTWPTTFSRVFRRPPAMFGGV